MTAISPRHENCPPWCVTDAGAAEHFGQPGFMAASMVSVFPAVLDDGDGPEVIIERIRSSAEVRAALGTPRGPAWVRLSPDMAENLAAVLDETGQGELSALIRKVASAITAAALPARDG